MKSTHSSWAGGFSTRAPLLRCSPTTPIRLSYLVNCEAGCGPIANVNAAADLHNYATEPDPRSWRGLVERPPWPGGVSGTHRVPQMLPTGRSPISADTAPRLRRCKSGERLTLENLVLYRVLAAGSPLGQPCAAKGYLLVVGRRAVMGVLNDQVLNVPSPRGDGYISSPAVVKPLRT